MTEAQNVPALRLKCDTCGRMVSAEDLACQVWGLVECKECADGPHGEEE